MRTTSTRRLRLPPKALTFLVTATCTCATATSWALNPPTDLHEIGSAAGPSPLPTAASTGWKHTNTVLQNCESYVEGNNYVLDGRATPLIVDSCQFSGRMIQIYGNVTLKKSHIIGGNGIDCAGPAVKIENGAGPVLIEDVEITTSNPNAIGGAPRQDRSICVGKGNAQPVTLRRVLAHDTMRGLDFTGQQNITVIDSYFGPNVSPPVGQPPGSCLNDSERAHASAIRAAGGSHDIKLINSVFHIGYCSWASGLIATYPENGPNYNWEVSGGLWIIDGENLGYGIAAGYTPPAEQPNHDFNIHGLSISTQYNANGCPAGCAQNWNKLTGTNVWSDVRKYNPGKPDHGQLISP